MWWFLACLGKNLEELEQDSAEESQNVVELGGSSRAIDVCQPREQHQLTIGLVAKECPGEVLDSYLEVVIQEFPFLQDTTYAFGPENGENWAIWHQGSDSVVLSEGGITLDWEGMWQQDTSFSGTYQGTTPDGTQLEGFISGFLCETC